MAESAAPAALAAPAARRPRLLVSNDDGINAPGLRALVTALSQAGFCDIYVSAPSGERSAQSHAITLGRYLSCAPTVVPGAVEAYAVEGTPADSTMLALYGPMFQDASFDLVLSGINRGDNAGLHVIYSGTVGAAREAACKGLPAIAFSLDNHKARQIEDYEQPARLCVPIVQAVLSALATSSEVREQLTAGCVLNVNFPLVTSTNSLKGLRLTHQGTGCVHPRFMEVCEAPGPHLPEIEEHTPPLRVFRNFAGEMHADTTPNSDGVALKDGWVSITPLSLRQDFAAHTASTTKAAAAIISTVADIVHAAAQAAGLAAFGASASAACG